jgi:hypothetical protein
MLNFEDLVRKVMDEWKIPAMSIAKVQGDEIVSKVSHLRSRYCKAHSSLELRLRRAIRHTVHNSYTLRSGQYIINHDCRHYRASSRRRKLPRRAMDYAGLEAFTRGLRAV